MTEQVEASQNGGLTQEQQQERVRQMMVPRPTPVGWTTDVVAFVGPNNEKRHLVQLTLLTPTGEHVTFWSPQDLSRITAELRQMTKEAAQRDAASPLWQPPSGLILPSDVAKE